MSEGKPSNPKHGQGIMKAPTSLIPSAPMYEVGLAFLEGHCKYGGHNYREVGVSASIYYDAARRHLDSWWEGDNADTGSDLHPLAHAVASMLVVLDGIMQGNLVDDRPPPAPKGWLAKMNERAKKIMAKYTDPKPRVTARSMLGRNDDVSVTTIPPAVTRADGMVQIGGVWVADPNDRPITEVVAKRAVD